MLLLPPWTRAPLRSFRQPPVLLAVAAAAAILTCASSSAAWFLSAASSASLHRMVADDCPSAAYPAVTVHGTATTGARLDGSATRAFAAAGLPAPGRTEIARGTVPALGGQGGIAPVRMWSGGGALASLTPVATAGGSGVWVPQDLAGQLAATAGSTIQVGAATVRVAGVYRNLYDEPVRPYWCPYRQLFLNLSFANVGPPPIAIATDPGVLARALGGLTDAAGQPLRVDSTWSAPIDSAHLTVSRARQVVAAQDRVAGALTGAFDPARDSPDGSSTPDRTGAVQADPTLRGFAVQATRIRDGLRGPVFPIALGGTLLALLLVGAAGSYWVDRRHAEVRLLAARGVGAAGLAGLAVLELALPAALGAAAGLALALGLVRWLGPAPELDGWAATFAVATTVAALAAGLALLSLVAGLRARDTVERPVGARRRWPAFVPWELLVLGAAGWAYHSLRQGRAVRLDHDVAQVNLLLVAFPLLFLAGGAVLLVRVLWLGLPLLRRASVHFGPACYLAACRVLAAPVVSASVLVAMSLPIGVLAYSGAITQTTDFMVAAKVRVFTGGAVSLQSNDLPTDPAALNRVGTLVLRYPDARVAGAPITVLAIDPATFARYAFWDDRFGGSLPDLLASLRTRPGSLAAIATGTRTGPQSLQVGRRQVPLEVVRAVRVLPGQRLDLPLYLVDASALGPVDDTAQRYAEVWTDNEAAARQAMTAQGMRVFAVSTDDQVRRVANLLGVGWAFGYLEALAALVGLVAVGGLLLYLETRQRARVASYALARRMGLRGRAHFGSLFGELGTLVGAAATLGAGLALLAVLAVYRLLDLDVDRPPPPLLSLPLADLAWAALAALVVALGAAAYAHNGASRADISEVMRRGT
jgi:putative ABC transport system permease protein